MGVPTRCHSSPCRSYTMKSICLLSVLLVIVASVHGNVLRQRRMLESGCPMMCPMNYEPVCGSNGKTYSNTCAMNVDACLTGTKITVAQHGRCGDVAMVDPIALS